MLDFTPPTLGGVAEWLNATVLKTVGPQGLVGSNPTPSATIVSTGSAWLPHEDIVYIMVRTRGPALASAERNPGPCNAESWPSRLKALAC
jgi:hypothetical protein